ncbi:MAG: glutamate-1-semialdehyde 2,1-aminomutase [Desulfurococcales archaeon]|nr:glutamate-1-semialdehyde 2,1-aminomutase [Desulfurococcales archaeon]
MATVKEEILERARRVLVGGVNSPVRALTRPEPIIAVSGEGPYLYDAKWGKLVDYVLGYGPLILGHKHPHVLEKIREALEAGWLYGNTSPLEVELAEKVVEHVYPGGKVRFVNSGTEATMLAIRLARAYTGRKLIVKFNGCYHGAHDHVLVGAGSAASHLGVPKSPGIPEEVTRLVLVVDYNDIDGLRGVFEERGEEIAAVIVEPVAGNYGVIPPREGFLEEIRRLTRKYGALMIMDEVITGFRLSLGGAQEFYGVRADLVTLGKVIGGGMPVGAVVGPGEIMDNLTPSGKVFNAGTFNGHPIAMAAGLATIEVLEREGLEPAIRHAASIEKIIVETLSSTGKAYTVNRVGPMLQFFIGVEKVVSPSDVDKADKKLYTRIHEELIKSGVFIAPSQLEAVFTSIVHTDTEAAEFAEAFEKALRGAGLS